jgi:hypothetical protein
MTTRLALVGRGDPTGLAPEADEADPDVTRARNPADVTFFLRAVSSGEGWLSRLFARTGAWGAPTPVYAAERVNPTQKEAIEHGRQALATTWAASALTQLRPSVVRAV